MENNHTPTPWKCAKPKKGFFCHIMHQPDDEGIWRNGNGIASTIHSQNSDEDAAFIVRAVNSHEKLLMCLKRWEKYAQDNLYSENKEDAGYCSFLKETREAIKGAE